MNHINLFSCNNKLRKNNKLKVIAPMWNYYFELPEGSHSVSDIQDYIIQKNMKHYPLIHPFIFTSMRLITISVQKKDGHNYKLLNKLNCLKILISTVILEIEGSFWQI